MTNIDKSDLRRVILTEPTQIMEGIKAAEHINIDGTFTSITLSGMGGSALPGNILRIFVNHLCDTHKQQRIAIYQNRFYTLPPEAYHNSLNIICSYSGNTEETIASFEECLAHDLPCVGISHGGKIAQMCIEHNIPHITIPYPYENFQPRMATGYFVFAMLKILARIGAITMDETVLQSVATNLEKTVADLESRGKELAAKCKNNTPIIYAGTKFKSLAHIWKIKINENAKTPAFWNHFPELNHNEMVGFTLPQASFFMIMLRDTDDHPQNKKRFSVMQELMTKQGIASEIIDIVGENDFEKVFSTLYLGDWTSYYLALEYHIDPTPVEMVETFKKMIEK